MSPTDTPKKSPSTPSILIASLIGTSIEWYDYYVFNTAAALVFGTLFFPKFSSVAGTLASFATFAVGFVARPLGAAIIGHFGDRIGRKSMLVLTLTMAGASTFLIGLLPTYTAIGVGAPLLLVLLRLLQGFGVGGEWGGAVLIATESASPRRRAFYGSFAQFGVPIGVLTSNTVFIAASALAGGSFLSWGWRVPFLVSILLVVVGLLARAKLTDTPEFKKAKDTNAVRRVPFGTLVRTDGWTLLLSCLASIAPPAIGYSVIVYMLTYGTDVVGFNRTTLLTLILISTVVWVAAIVICGVLSDKYGAKIVYAIGALTAVIWPLPMFALVNTGSTGLALLGFIVAAIVQGIMAGAQGGWFTDIFGVNVRYSGISIAYQVGGMIGGAITPIAATALYGAFHSSTPIGIYLSSICLVSLVAVLCVRRTGTPVAEREPAAL